MIEAWFNPEQAQYFTIIAFTAFVALLSPAIQKGRYRNLVFATWYAFIGLGIVLLATASIALIGGQPEHVVRPLVSGGIALTAAFGISLVGVFRAYRRAEYRQVVAQDL